MKENIEKCPICNSKEKCEHNLIRFVSIWYPNFYQEENFKNDIANWLENKNTKFEEVCSLDPGVWGSSPELKPGKRDYLFGIRDFIRETENFVLSDCVYTILNGMQMENELKASRYAYLESKNGVKTYVDSSLEKLKFANDKLHIVLQYWATDGLKIADKANRYLGIFFSLQEPIAIFNKMIISDSANKLYKTVDSQKGSDVVQVSKDLCSKLLFAIGKEPPEDAHRENKKVNEPKLKSYTSLWEAMQSDYSHYREGLSGFMKLHSPNNEAARNVHNALLEIGKYLVESANKDKSSQMIDGIKINAERLKNNIQEIQKLLFKKFNLRWSRNIRKQMQLLNELANANKIPESLPATFSNLKYLLDITGGVRHAGDEVPEPSTTVLDAGFLFYTLRFAFDYIFKHVLPVFANEYL